MKSTSLASLQARSNSPHFPSAADLLSSSVVTSCRRLSTARESAEVKLSSAENENDGDAVTRALLLLLLLLSPVPVLLLSSKVFKNEQTQ